MAGVPTDRRERSLASGRARFVDDAIPPRGLLEVALVKSPYARAEIVSIDTEEAGALPGVEVVLTSADIPGENNLSPEAGSMPLLAEQTVEFHGQPVAAVVATTSAIAEQAADLVVVEYQPRPPVLGVEEAIALQSFHGDECSIECGEIPEAPAEGEGSFAKQMVISGQEHFALESGVAWAQPDENDELRVTVSAEDLGFVRRGLASLLSVPMSQLKIECPRVGGSFGGKLTGALIPAGVAALAARKTGLAVRARLDREEEFRLTGKQNPACADFTVHYDSSGLICAFDCMVHLDGGWAVDRADSVLANILRHLDSAYYIPNACFRGRVCRTNLPPSTSTLTDGASIAALIAEEVVAGIAAHLEVIPEAIRQRNFYQRDAGRGTTPYGQDIDDLRLQEAWKQLLESSNYGKRRSEIEKWNKGSRFAKRGLAVVPAKIGSGAAEAEARQASATVSLLPDGSAQVVCGEVEIGGAMRRSIAAFVADQLGIEEGALRITAGQTDHVSAAHHGELHAEAVLDACRQLRERLRILAARLLEARGVEISDLLELRFVDGGVSDVGQPDSPLPLTELIAAAVADDINVSATGYSNAAEILGGRTYRDFAAATAAAEVMIDGFTGEVSVLRADVIQDVGRQLDPAAEIGQIRGAFLQGVGWLTCEDLLWSSSGEIVTASADSYLIPTTSETPLQFNVNLLSSYGGYPKEPGGPAYCVALAVREAIRDAVMAFGKAEPGFSLPTPATPEAVYFALHGRHS